MHPLEAHAPRCAACDHGAMHQGAWPRPSNRCGPRPWPEGKLESTHAFPPPRWYRDNLLGYSALMPGHQANRAVAIAVGVLIRSARQRRKLSSQDCADAAGLRDRRNWLRYEKGKFLPTCITLWRIAAALGVSADSLCPQLLLRCKPARRGRNTAGPLFAKPLTGRDRQWLRWFAERVPGFWQGVVWRGEELIALAVRTGDESVGQRRDTIRRRLWALQDAARIVWMSGGRYRLNGRFCVSAAPAARGVDSNTAHLDQSSE